MQLGYDYEITLVLSLDFCTFYQENTGLFLFHTIFSRMEMKVAENHYISV